MRIDSPKETLDAIKRKAEQEKRAGVKLTPYQKRQRALLQAEATMRLAAGYGY